MAGMTVDGLISGLNTTSLINQLMSAEAAPQNALKGKVAETETFVKSLQALNVKLASLAGSATTTATAASWEAVTATSSATSVTATTATGAQPSSLTFSIGSLAARQTSVSAPATDLAGYFGGATPSSLTLAKGSGADLTVASIDLTGVTTLAGLASSINAAGAGVTASIVQVSPTQSRLQLTGAATGAAAAFDLYSGTLTAGEVQSAPPPVLMGRSGSTAITAAADASITLWQGTPAQQAITSATNTFSGVLAGVDLTISAAELNPVTVTVGRNDGALKTLASGLVANLSTVFSEIKSRTATTTTTAADGRTLVSGGIFSGDSAVRAVQQGIFSAATNPVNGISPSTVGIVVGKDGSVTFDDAKFTAAMSADPANVQAVISGLAERVQAAATSFSDSRTGSISLKIQGQQDYVHTLSDQVSNWDVRLNLRQGALNLQFSNLEVSLGKLKSQSDWLSAQLS